VIRVLVEPLLAHFGKATVHGTPTRYERIGVHLAYAVGWALVATVPAGRFDPAFRVGLVPAVETVGLMAALAYLSLWWSVRYRRVHAEPWFLSHLVWLTFTYTWVLLAAAVGALALAIGVLFALAVPPIAPIVVYGPLFLGAAVGLWFAGRSVVGWIAYWRGRPVGYRFRMVPGRTG
jgi:uncharacterized membrane protein